MLLGLPISVVFWFIANKEGLGKTHDSYYYLELASSQDFIWFKSQNLLPTLLQLVHNPETLAFWLNLVCFMAIQLCWYWIFAQSQISFRYRLVGFYFICFSVPLFSVSSFVWTEPLFILITSVAFVLMFKWEGKKEIIYLIILVPLCLAAIWARKVGLIFTVSAVVYLVKVSFWQGKNGFVFYLTVGLLLLTGWVCFYTGEKPSLEFIPQNLIYNLTALSSWFLPVSLPDLFKILLGLGISMVFVVKHKRTLLGEFFLIYFILYFLVRLPIDREFPEEAHRYFSIFHAPFIFVLVQQLDHTFGSSPKRSWILHVALILLLIVSVVRITKSSIHWNQTRQLQKASQSRNLNSALYIFALKSEQNSKRYGI